MIGCFAIFRNRLSYSNQFSTMLRTTSDEDLSNNVENDSRGDAEPLPEHFDRARLRIGQETSSSAEIQPNTKR